MTERPAVCMWTAYWIGPLVIRADDRRAGKATGLFGAKNRPSVPAGIVESLETTRFVAGHEHTLVPDGDDLEVTATGQLFSPAGVDPALIPNRLQLPAKMIRVDVGAGCQARLGAGESMSARSVHRDFSVYGI